MTVLLRGGCLNAYEHEFMKLACKSHYQTERLLIASWVVSRFSWLGSEALFVLQLGGCPALVVVFFVQGARDNAQCCC